MQKRLMIEWGYNLAFLKIDDLRIRVAQSDIAESILPDPTHLAWHRRKVYSRD